MLHARNIISAALDARVAKSIFFGNVATVYALLGPTLDAYVFCMSDGDKQSANRRIGLANGALTVRTAAVFV